MSFPLVYRYIKITIYWDEDDKKVLKHFYNVSVLRVLKYTPHSV